MGAFLFYILAAFGLFIVAGIVSNIIMYLF